MLKADNQIEKQRHRLTDAANESQERVKLHSSHIGTLINFGWSQSKPQNPSQHNILVSHFQSTWSKKALQSYLPPLFKLRSTWKLGSGIKLQKHCHHNNTFKGFTMFQKLWHICICVYIYMYMYTYMLIHLFLTKPYDGCPFLYCPSL